MADRNYAEFRYSLEKKVVDLYAKVTFSGGAATVARGKGIKSITKNGTGTYDIVLSDKYKALLGFDVMFKDASSAASNVPLSRFAYISAEDVTAGTMTIKFTVLANTVTDPANSTTAYLHFALSNSSAL